MTSIPASAPTFGHTAFQLRNSYVKGHSIGPKSHAINALRRRTADPTQHADKGKPRPASALGVSSPAAAGKTEEEYVKNLQQQLFLLEMETRYLRARSDDTGLYQQTGELPEGRGDTGAGADKRRVPLGEVIKDLKQKYADLQDEYKEEVQTLKTNLFSVQSQYRTSQEKLSEATKQHTTLTDQFTTFQKESNTEKQGLLRELSRLKQQVANADGEAKRWEGMYERAIQEVEAIRADKRRLESVVDSSKRRIEEVEAAGTHYEKRIEELCHEIASVKHSPPPEPSEALTTHIASLQQTLNAVQSTLSTMQSTSTTQSKHISDLTTQLKVAESINKRLLTDVETQTARATALDTRCKSYQARLDELDRTLDTTTAELHRASSARNSLTDRLTTMSSSLQIQTEQIAELETANKLLIKELGETKAGLEAQGGRLKVATEERGALAAEVDEMREKIAHIKRLENLVRECEERGENYLDSLHKFAGGLKDQGFVWKEELKGPKR